MLTMQQLEVLVAVDETGSLRKAADLLYLSQPALSAVVKKMEDELGVVLFERKSTGLALSSIGNDILPIARNVIEQMKTINVVCSRYKLSNSGDILGKNIVLGGYPLIAAMLFPRIIASLNRYLPELKIYTKNIPMDNDLIISEDTEVILYIENVSEENYSNNNMDSVDGTKKYRLCALYPCIKAHKEYFSNSPTVIQATDLVELPLLTLFSNNETATFTGSILQYLRRYKTNLDIIDCSSQSVVNAYIDAKMGVGLGIYINEMNKKRSCSNRIDGNYVYIPLDHNDNTQFYLSLMCSNDIPEEFVSVIKNILMERQIN